MNLENLKQTISSAATATGYDTESLDTISDTAQVFVEKGKSVGKRIKEMFQNEKIEKQESEVTTDDTETMESKNDSDILRELRKENEDRLLEKIREDVNLQIDGENHELIISGGTLTDETTDALREYLVIKGKEDEAWAKPDLTISEDVKFGKEKTIFGEEYYQDYPEFRGMTLGKLNVQSQNIKNANGMFACMIADEITIADQPNLESADNMFAYTQADAISIGKLPEETDISFSLMKDCPSDVSVNNTLYKVSDATIAEIDDKRTKMLAQFGDVSIVLPNEDAPEDASIVLPNDSGFHHEVEPYTDAPEDENATSKIKAAERAAKAIAELGLPDEQETASKDEVFVDSQFGE